MLLDQFGVLHDGKRAYPEAVAAVQRLADDGVSVYILSNSSRRSEVALQKIEALGFPRACFSGARIAPLRLECERVPQCAPCLNGWVTGVCQGAAPDSAVGRTAPTAHACKMWRVVPRVGSLIQPDR